MCGDFSLGRGGIGEGILGKCWGTLACMCLRSPLYNLFMLTSLLSGPYQDEFSFTCAAAPMNDFLVVS